MMPHKHVRYSCDKCHKRFATCREAEDCEIGHIVKDVIDGFKTDLGGIFNKVPPTIRSATDGQE